MRNGWRGLIAVVAGLLCGGAASAAGRVSDAVPGSGEPPFRLTVEVAWTTPPPPSTAGEPGEVELEVTDGRVVDAVAWPGGPSTAPGPAAQGGGVWRLGPGRSGRVRVRVEATPGASLLFHAGGQAIRYSLPLVLDGPRRSPSQSPVELTVERVAWDAITVDLGGGADGVVAPGAKLPVSLGFHVLATEPTDVAVRCSAELRPVRGGDPVWKDEVRASVPANSDAPPPAPLELTAPEAEGTYVLELKAAWEAAPAHEGNKLLNRLIRRGRRGLLGPSTATRRVTLVVLGDDPAGAAAESGPGAKPATKGEPPARDVEVDAIDLTRPRGHRPSASGRSPWPAEGRSAWAVPEEALAEAPGRDRLRGWITRGGPELARLGPAEASGLAWSALALKTPHPGRPHRLSLTVAAGHPADLGVALVGPAGEGPTGRRPRLLLDASASGPPILPDGTPARFSWLVWPDTADPVLVLVNRAGGAPVQVASVALTELAEVPEGPVLEPPRGAPARGLGIDLSGVDPYERFGGATESGLVDALAAARNLGRYLAYCGASAVVLPEGLADRERRRALDGQSAEDPIGPDRLDLALRALGRKTSAWVELDYRGALPGLPPAGSPEALARGLVRVDRRGLADGPSYHPLSDDVRGAMQKKAAAAVSAHKGVAGVLVRLGPGPTLLGAPDTGLDDATFARFVREAFDAETARTVPGRGAGSGADRFAARARFVSGPGRMPWLSWRSKQLGALYGGLAAAVKGASPGALLAVATPGTADGPSGSEARRADLAGLAPSLAWRAVGLDLDAWPAEVDAPVVLRGVGLGGDDLARDLAADPDLDARVAARPARGALLDVEDPALIRASANAGPPRGRGASAATDLYLTAPAVDPGPAGDEPLAHALASLDARWVWLSSRAVAGHEGRLQSFARVFRALPATPAVDHPPPADGVTVRSHRAGGQTFFALANDTPYPILVDTAFGGPASAAVYDFGRATTLRPRADAAGRHLVLELAPFGTAAVRVGSAEANVGSVTPYPSDAVLAGLRAQLDGLTARLSSLGHAGEPEKPAAAGHGHGHGGGPPNPGFEPVEMTDPDAKADPPAPGGWQAVGGMGSGVVVDPSAPHGGRGALRLDAPDAPASAVSDDFAPGARAAGLVVRAWLRSDRPDAKARLWIEGEAGGRPYRRVCDLSVPTAWADRTVRANDLPAGGLDAMRLRFELTAPGTLWVDDVSVTAEALSEPERRNARNALLAALRAYEEKRYAEFARLAGSHWAREAGAPAPTPAAGGAAADRAGVIRTGDANALPPGRRLR